jgi:hypothetical protein
MDISFKDDVTVILLLDVSFMIERQTLLSQWLIDSKKFQKPKKQAVKDFSENTKNWGLRTWSQAEWPPSPPFTPGASSGSPADELQVKHKQL